MWDAAFGYTRRGGANGTVWQEASIVQLVVCFVRNLLSVPDARATDGSRGDHRSQLREELLFRLDSDHMLELFIMFASETDKVSCLVLPI